MNSITSSLVIFILIILGFIYIYKNEDVNLNNYINETRDSKSIENFQSLNEEDNSKLERTLQNKKEADKLVKDLEDKYQKYENVEIPIIFNDYGNKCEDWSKFDSPYKMHKDNLCTPETDFKCMMSDSSITSCKKMYNKLENDTSIDINPSQHKKKIITIRTKINEIKDKYSKEIDKLINLNKERQNTIYQQEYTLGQNDKMLILYDEKNTTLKNDEKKITEINNINNIIFKKKEDIEYNKYKTVKKYAKILVIILIIIIVLNLLMITV